MGSNGTHKPDRDLLVVVGKSGYGKTRWTQAYIRRIARLLILDPVDGIARYPYPGRYGTPAELADDVKPDGLFRLKTDDVSAVDTLAALAYAAQRTTLVLEEANRYASPRRDVEKDYPALMDVVFRGRQTRTSLIVVAQRAATIHIHLRSQWTRIIAFNQTEPSDVRWLEEQAGADLSDRLPRFAMGRYLDLEPGREALEKNLLDPQKPVDTARGAGVSSRGTETGSAEPARTGGGRA